MAVTRSEADVQAAYQALVDERTIARQNVKRAHDNYLSVKQEFEEQQAQEPPDEEWPYSQS